MIKRTLLLLTIFATMACQNSYLEITNHGTSNYRIVISQSADSITRRAADELQRYIKQISGAGLAITTDTAAIEALEIVIGTTNRTSPAIGKEELGMDGVRISTVDERIFIEGGSGKGVLYAVYTLLDEKMGVRLYAADAEVVPTNASITLPRDLYIEQQPVITFRDPHYKGTNDSHYIDWHRLSHDTTGEKPEWGLWVHTFTRLVPPDQYWDSHPEYYSLVNGKRARTQLCLSNPAVLEIVCRNLEQEMALKPEARYWSVSSDDNFGYCQCEDCQKADEVDGSPTGSVIQFVNKVAQRFPDKVISTLAYQYSRAAPKVTRPEKNVNIMFCNIECNRSKPIPTDPSSESFRHDMEQWAKLTDNILVWDYIIQFKNLISPFPNFHTLQPNIKYFVDNSVVALFEQGNREVGGEFAEMRSYVISKLLWNPMADTDSLITDFCTGYYGAGGIFVKQYVDLMTQNLINSGDGMSIFGSPCDAGASYLSQDNMADYQRLFDCAEEAVSDNALLLKRVKIARQPLYYAELEMSKLDPYAPGRGIFIKSSDGKWVTDPTYSKKLENFVSLCNEQGVTRVTEWHTTPDEYLKLMSDIAVVRQEGNLSFQKGTKFKPTPAERYAKGADKVMTDGIFGSTDYAVQWLGWETPEFEITVDLGEKTMIRNIETHFLQELSAWIFFPKAVQYFVSSDGESFVIAGTVTSAEDRETSAGTKSYELKTEKQARWVRAKVTGTATCPQWHQGAGGPAWTFCDEMIVK